MKIGNKCIINIRLLMVFYNLYEESNIYYIKICLKKLLLLLPILSLSQRGKTGDEVFSNRFPANIKNEIFGSSLRISNEVEHDIIVLIRDQNKKYLRHVYIINSESFNFKSILITRLYVQFKFKKLFFEDIRTNLNKLY
jgi:hypothetical protein